MPSHGCRLGRGYSPVAGLSLHPGWLTPSGSAACCPGYTACPCCSRSSHPPVVSRSGLSRFARPSRRQPGSRSPGWSKASFSSSVSLLPSCPQRVAVDGFDRAIDNNLRYDMECCSGYAALQHAHRARHHRVMAQRVVDQRRMALPRGEPTGEHADMEQQQEKPAQHAAPAYPVHRAMVCGEPVSRRIGIIRGYGPR